LKIQEDAPVYQNFISYLYEAQHVFGDTLPIIGAQNCTSSLWFCIHGGLLDVLLDADNVQQHIQQSSTYAKPEAASAVLGSQ
jgi:hypothetical protein